VVVVAAACQTTPNPTSSVTSETTPAPLATVQVSPRSDASSFDCDSIVQLSDLTGLVSGCTAVSDTGRLRDLDGFTYEGNQLIARWVSVTCTPDRQAGFRFDGTKAVLSISEQRPATMGPPEACAGGRQPILLTLTFAAPLPGSITASRNGEALPRLDSPLSTSPSQSPTSSQAAGTPCSYEQPDVITWTDHSGLVTSCSAVRGPETSAFDPAQVSVDGTALTVTAPVYWCALKGIAVNFWHPVASGVTPYQVEVRSLIEDEFYPTVCPVYDLITTLTTSEQVAATDVTAFASRLVNDRASQDETSMNTKIGRFDLRMGLDSAHYGVGQVIHPSAVLRYDGSTEHPDVTVDPEFGLVGPWYVEKLDGDLAIENSLTHLMSECRTVTDGSEYAFDYLKPPYPTDGPPTDPRLQVLYSDPQLRLLAGTWRIGVSSSLGIGCSRSGTDFSLAVSVVVEVR